MTSAYAADLVRTLDLFFAVTAAECLEIRRLRGIGAESCFLAADDIERVAELIIATDDPEISAHYITLNPIKPALLSHSHARFSALAKGQAASDADVICRRLLLVDFDPVRTPKKISASDSEKAAAHERALD